MQIKTPNGILEGDTIPEIIKKHGKDCLQGASLYGADLRRADLRRADLSRANLSRADLSDADLSRADLSRADLSDARNIPPIVTAQTSILPDEGDVIGWKKAVDEDLNPVIVKLLIPADAQRSNATGRKCRASKTKVLDIQNLDGESLDGITAHSKYYKDFIYRKGETVEVDNFETDRWKEYATGIHFYITRLEAVNY